MMMSIYREISVQIPGSAKDVYLRYLRESWQYPWQINVGFAHDSPIIIRSIGSNKHRSNKYIVLTIYLSSRLESENIITIISLRKIYRVDNLKV